MSDCLYVNLSVNFRGETWFSRPLVRIEVWFVLCTFISYLSIFSIDILSVSLLFRLQTTCISLLKIWDNSLIIFVTLPLINDNLLYEFFVSRSFGQAFKQLCYLWMLSSLCCKLNIIYSIFMILFINQAKKHIILN